MPDMESNLLEKLIESNKEQAKNIAQLSMDFSTYKNEQAQINTKLLGYLENNAATGQKGLMNEVADLKTQIKGFDKKLAIFTTCAVAVGTLFKFLLSKISFLKLFG